MTPLSCCPTPEPRAYMNSQVHSRKRRWHKRRGQNQEFVPAEFVRRLHWGKRLARRDIKTLVIKSCAYEKGGKKSGVLSMHRQTTEEWGQRTEGARVNVGGGGGGKRGGDEMPPQDECLQNSGWDESWILSRLFSNLRVWSFIRTCSKVSKLYAQTPFPNPGAKASESRLRNSK